MLLDSLLNYCKEFRCTFSYCNCVLELCRARAIGRADRPVVWQQSCLVSPGIDHWLNGADHAGPQFHSGTRMPIMGYLWILVQGTTDAVANILAHRRKSLRLSIGLNCRTDITKLFVWPCLLNTELQAMICNLHQPLRCPVKLSNGKGHTRVADPAFIEYSDINTYNVAFV